MKAHRRGVLAQLAVEPERALAGKTVYGLVFQVRLASPAVEARHVDTAEELDGAVLSAVVGRADASVVRHSVHAARAVLARLVAQTFVDLRLAVIALIAGEAGAGVVVDAVHASSELARGG